MCVAKSKGGRPYLTEEQKAQRKEYLLLKVEPYLKSGLSVNKSLREAKIFNSEFYKYKREDRLFGEKIEHFRQFISVLVNQAIVTELFRIIRKQQGNQTEQIPPQSLPDDERDFLFWFALHANICRDEWGRRVANVEIDPEAEFQRIKSNLIETKN